jgi:NAD+ synthase (glutamine-hydrolysing)
MKIGIIQPKIVVGDLMGNAGRLKEAYLKAVSEHADIIVGPEDAIAGYCEGDQRLYSSFLVEHDAALSTLLDAVGEVGLLIGITEKNKRKGKPLLNTAVLIENGKITRRQSKTNLATDSVFNDYRWYEPNADPIRVFEYRGKRVAILICQDLWEKYDAAHGEHFFKRNPVSELAKERVDLILVPNASPHYWGKGRARYEMVKAAAETCKAAIAYANYAGGHDELVFDGRSMVMNMAGKVMGAGKAFVPDVLVADLDGPEVDYPFGDDIGDLAEALTTGLRDYANKAGMRALVLGLSGGIDSALCAALAVRALGPERVVGIRMPSKYSSQHSLDDALTLGKNLGIRVDTVPIEDAYQTMRDMLATGIGKHEPGEIAGDVTEENLQARIRGQIVMAYTNRMHGMAIATGNKSEFSVGYATLYGDMCGGFALIKDVFKLDVYKLSEWFNREKEVIPKSSITKPPSAELRPDQKDSDSLPDYPVLDPILKGYIEEFKGKDELIAQGFPAKEVERVIAMTDRAEFKRRQAPPGPIVSREGLAWLNRQYPMQTQFRP